MVPMPESLVPVALFEDWGDCFAFPESITATDSPAFLSFSMYFAGSFFTSSMQPALSLIVDKEILIDRAAEHRAGRLRLQPHDCRGFGLFDLLRRCLQGSIMPLGNGVPRRGSFRCRGLGKGNGCCKAGF